MNVKEIAKRYDMTPNEVRTFLIQNFVDMNISGEHVKNVKRNWHVDEEGIRMMDNLLGFTGGKESIEDTAVKNADELTAPSNLALAMNTCDRLKAENDKLTAALQQTTSAYEKLQGDYNTLQDKFLSLQEGRESMNSSMIRQYKSKSESLGKDLAIMRSRCEALQTAKEAQYEEMQARIDEMQEELSNKTDVMKEKLESDHRAFESKKLADKLYKDLSDANKEIDILKAKLQKADLDRTAIMKQIEEYKRQAVLISQTLLTAQIQAQAISENELELMPEVKSTTAGKDMTTLTKNTAKADADTKDTISGHTAAARHTHAGQKKQKEEQQALLKAIAKENSLQEKSGQAAGQEGVFHTIRQRIASFIGFM